MLKQNRLFQLLVTSEELLLNLDAFKTHQDTLRVTLPGAKLQMSPNSRGTIRTLSQDMAEGLKWW